MPSLSNTDERVDDIAVDAAVVAPSSPARPVRLSYGSPDKSTRKSKAIQHATPPTGGRPPLERRARPSVPVEPSINFDPAMFQPLLARVLTPPAIDDLSPNCITQSQQDPSSQSFTNTVEGPSVPTPSTVPCRIQQPSHSSASNKSRKATSSEQNKKQVVNNDITSWSRPLLDDDVVTGFEEDAFNAFSKKIDEQLMCKFQAKRQSKVSRENSMGLGRRSEARIDLLNDSEADQCVTVNIKRLSRLHWEDCSVLYEKEPLVIFFPWNGFMDCYHDEIPKLNSKVGLKLLSVRTEQKKGGGGGGQFILIGGTKYVCLKSYVSEAREYHAIHSGAVTLSTYQSLFKYGGGGFTVTFDGTTVPLSFCWRDVFDFAPHVFFFGRPKESTRRYNIVFRRKKLLNTIRCIYQSLVMETFGDHVATFALAHAYKTRCMEILLQPARMPITPTPSPITSVDALLNFNEHEKTAAFFAVFDSYCRRRFFKIITGLNDHNHSLIPPEIFEHYVQLCERFLPRLFGHLSNLRNVRGSYRASDKKLVAGKRRQVFMQILILKRMRDRRALKWWSLIQAVSYYGWGVGKSGLDANSYWGMTCSSTSRDRCLAKLTENLHDRQIEFMSREDGIMYVMDNFQRGKKLKTPRGNHSNGFLGGTNQMCHQVRPFEDDVNDDYYQQLIYSCDQDYPSPRLMPHYHNHPSPASASFFFDHETMASPDAIDKSGEAIRCYIKGLKVANMIIQFERIFVLEDHNDEMLPCNLDSTIIETFAELCNSSGLKSLFKSAKEYQRIAVKHWNPYIDDVTLSNYMGCSPLGEESAQKAGAHALNFCEKYGMIARNAAGGYECTVDFECKMAIMIGDVKSADNVEKLARDFANRPLSMRDNSATAECFTKALRRLMIIPGDWHAGLSMLQSIFNIFWEAFLEPLKVKLSWKNIIKDCSQQYFRCSKMVKLVYLELIDLLVKTYVSNKLDGVRAEFISSEVDTSDANYCCHVATSFLAWVDDLTEGSDYWLRTCALFVLMAKEFLTFVESYRCGDSIAIENGYQSFVSVWRCLGQTRYLERHWRQQEEMMVRFPYPWLETLRRFCTVGR